MNEQIKVLTNAETEAVSGGNFFHDIGDFFYAIGDALRQLFS